jgi:hypothetical protein
LICQLIEHFSKHQSSLYYYRFGLRCWRWFFSYSQFQCVSILSRKFNPLTQYVVVKINSLWRQIDFRCGKSNCLLICVCELIVVELKISKCSVVIKFLCTGCLPFLLQSAVEINVKFLVKTSAAYSRNLCHSAIWRRGALHTSFQWCSAEPVLLVPPNSSRPITCKHAKQIYEKRHIPTTTNHVAIECN